VNTFLNLPSTTRVHAAQFYDTDLHLYTAVAEFFSHAIRHHEPAVMIARPQTYEAVKALTGGGTHIQFVDIAEALRQFMHDGMPDPVRFERAFQSLLNHLRQSPSSRAIWIFGEAVDELCRTGNHAAALRMEELWNAHFADPGISVMCGYSLAAFDNETDISRIRNICRVHTQVLPPEGFTAADERTRSELITVLQHRARVLDKILQRRPDAGAAPHLQLSMVYVIDDDESVRRSLARLLASLDMNVQTFASAEAFLAEADDRRGACLIVDVQLLGMSGTELQRRMAEAYWTLPVIAMSGAHDPVVEMEAMHRGARAFLRKPFDVKALRDAIDRAVGNRS
jgi:CheY-like chemotaxis protein